MAATVPYLTATPVSLLGPGSRNSREPSETAAQSRRDD